MSFQQSLNVMRRIADDLIAANQLKIEIGEDCMPWTKGEEHSSATQEWFEVTFKTVWDHIQAALCEPAFAAGPLQKWQYTYS